MKEVQIYQGPALNNEINVELVGRLQPKKSATRPIHQQPIFDVGEIR